MFDLQKAICSWRKELSESESLDNLHIDEMQTHLTDEIESLNKAGLSPEEAFFVAKSRLGNSQAISTEFAKVNGSLIWQRRIFWMLAGIFMFIVAGALAAVAGQLTRCIAVLGGFTGFGVGIIDSVTHMFVLVAVMFLVCKLFSSERAGRFFANSRIATISLLASGAGVVLLRMTSRVVPAFTVRVLGPEEYGRIIMASQVGMLVWLVLGPIILACILVWLGKRKRGNFA